MTTPDRPAQTRPAPYPSPRADQAPPASAFDCVALVLQGGGALGAYQGGVYEALAEAGIHPNWVAGISIGALNAAIIAGSPPHARVERLRAFWDRVTTDPLGLWLPWLGDGTTLPGAGDGLHALLENLNAFRALTAGAPGFFEPRLPPPWFCPPGCPESTSFYDTSALIGTLERLVDFDRINSRAVRLSVGAVNVRTGNFVYFDTATHTITPQHILASGALPPGFPAIEIEGEHYWDGGLVSNTPLQWVVDAKPERDTLAFQVDLWSSRGHFPQNLTEVATRQKEIQFSSRTRAATDRLKDSQRLRASVARLLDDLPEAMRDHPAVQDLAQVAEPKVYNVVHLIYRSKHYEGNTKDYEFSRLSMAAHWRAGYQDAVRALRHPEIFRRPDNAERFRAFDFEHPGPTAAPSHRSRAHESR